MLYPLSYEGARAQLTCQRVPRGDGEYQRVPPAPGAGTADRRITRRAHRAAVDRRRANVRLPVPTRASQRQRLTEHSPSTPQDPQLALRPG